MEETSMIRISVLYPDKEGARFDHAYYAQKHMPLVKQRLAGSGLVRLEIDKGLAGGGPGTPAPFVCVGHLYFNALGDFQKGIEAHGAELMGDIPNYTDIQPVIQISEIVG
jgi:uncharacterized protein (TIGR02118 family)